MSDAFTAGVEPGGLTTAQEIKILLCYMLHSVGQPIHRDQVTEIVVGGGMANYFDTEEAIEELLRLQHLVQSEDRLIATTVTGGQIGESLATRIPYTLRERSVKSALLLLRRRRIEAENRVAITPQEEGGFRVTCSVMDGERELLSVSLPVVDKFQAEQIKERFLTDPSLLYRSNLSVLTGGAEMRRNGTQLVIQLGE